MKQPAKQSSAEQSNMCQLEKYSDLFGKPKEGAHAYRICDVAIVDVILMALLAWALQSWVFKQSSYVSVLSTTWLTAIILHRLFGVRTTVDKVLFPGAP